MSHAFMSNLYSRRDVIQFKSCSYSLVFRPAETYSRGPLEPISILARRSPWVIWRNGLIEFGILGYLRTPCELRDLRPEPSVRSRSGTRTAGRGIIVPAPAA